MSWKDTVILGLSPLYAYGAAALVVAGACTTAGWKGYTAGRDRVQGQWDASVVDIAQQRAAQEAANRFRADSASATYQSTLAALERRNAASNKQVRQATSSPLVCPAGGTLGDVRIPLSLLRLLDSASADPSEDPASAP